MASPSLLLLLTCLSLLGLALSLNDRPIVGEYSSCAVHADTYTARVP